MREENTNTGRSPESAEQPVQQPEKKKSRRSYIENIHRTADGGIIYTGPCFEYDEETNKRGSVLLRLWLLALPAIAACIISGCITTPFIGSVFYKITLGAEFVFICLITWAICRITGNGRVIRDYVRRQTFGALSVLSWIAVGSAGIGLIGATVFIIVNGTSFVTLEGEITDKTFTSIVYICLKAVVIVCCVFIARYAPSVAWKETAEKV